MNFYFNYFANIEREQVYCVLCTVYIFLCLFLKKVKKFFPSSLLGND